MKRLLSTLAALALLVAAIPASAVGLYPGLPIEGGASYCAGYAIYNTANTVPGTLPTPNVCSVTTPAGLTAFVGTEALAVDTFGLNQNGSGTSVSPQTQLVGLIQLGQGAFVNDATTSTSVTVGCTTAFEYISGTKTNPTYTFCASPVQGQKFTIIQGANLTTGITLAAGSGSTCLPACGAKTPATAGLAYSWVYNGTVWYEVQ